MLSAFSIVRAYKYSALILSVMKSRADLDPAQASEVAPEPGLKISTDGGGVRTLHLVCDVGCVPLQEGVKWPVLHPYR